MPKDSGGGGRALLTEREREVLREGPNSDDYDPGYYYNTRHRVRERVEKLGRDLEAINETFPELSDDLEAALCGDAEQEGEPVTA